MSSNVVASNPADRRSFFDWILNSLRPAQHDFTEGAISRAVILLAIPMVLEMMMESLFFIVDMFWVTRLGSNAVATVGLTESLLTAIFSVAFGISMSTTAMVARRVGEKDIEGASTAAAQSIVLGISVAAVIGIPCAIFARRLLEAMGAPPEIVSRGAAFATIQFASSGSIMLLFLNNAIFRGAGDAAIAMRVLWISNAINLVIDPILIFGLGPIPALGVTGAAVSTLIGRTCGVIYQFWLLGGHRGRIGLGWRDMQVQPKVLWTLVKVSSTGVAQFLIGHSSWVLLVRMTSTFGSAAVAGYAIGVRIFIFIILPSWGLSGAAATMVGQNLGAGKPARAERAVFVTGAYNMIFLGLVAVAFLAVPEQIAGLFTHDPEVLPVTVSFLRILALGNLSYAVGMVMLQSFNGAGDTVRPTLINIFGYWCFQLPLAYLLSQRYGWGVRGVFTAIPAAETLIALIGLTVFLRGGWKTRKI